MKLQNMHKKLYGNLYYFMEYKNRKPFFKKPIKITIGNPLNEIYYMIENFVFEGKQILALKQENDPNTIVLVEAKIEEGQLTHVSMLSDEFIGKIVRMFKKTI